jgi:hypothetical protein
MKEKKAVPSDIVRVANHPDGAGVRVQDRGYKHVTNVEGGGRDNDEEGEKGDVESRGRDHVRRSYNRGLRLYPGLYIPAKVSNGGD